MKRYPHLLVMLLCLPQINHANEEPVTAPPIINLNLHTGVFAAVILGAGACIYEAGKYNERNRRNSEQNTKEMKHTVKAFERFKENKEWNQESFAKEVIATFGSVTAGRKQLSKLIEHSKTLDCDVASAVGSDLLPLIERAMNSNNHVAMAQRAERTKALQQAQEKAHLEKQRYEAQAAQNLASATAGIKQQVTKMAETTQNIENRMYDCIQQCEDQDKPLPETIKKLEEVQKAHDILREKEIALLQENISALAAQLTPQTVPSEPEK